MKPFYYKVLRFYYCYIYWGGGVSHFIHVGSVCHTNSCFILRGSWYHKDWESLGKQHLNKNFQWLFLDYWITRSLFASCKLQILRLLFSACRGSPMVGYAQVSRGFSSCLPWEIQLLQCLWKLHVSPVVWIPMTCVCQDWDISREMESRLCHVSQGTLEGHYIAHACIQKSKSQLQ